MMKLPKKILTALLATVYAATGAFAVVSVYITGTITGTVAQAITVEGCTVDVGACTISDDHLSFTWDMGTVYQGDKHTATITIANSANQDIQVKLEVSEVSATGGNNQFEGSIEVPTEPITVPAGGTADATITVNINPAEEPEEQFTATIQVVPVTE